jgi:hypothetical protein
MPCLGMETQKLKPKMGLARDGRTRERTRYCLSRSCRATSYHGIKVFRGEVASRRGPQIGSSPGGWSDRQFMSPDENAELPI